MKKEILALGALVSQLEYESRFTPLGEGFQKLQITFLAQLIEGHMWVSLRLPLTQKEVVAVLKLWKRYEVVLSDYLE